MTYINVVTTFTDLEKQLMPANTFYFNLNSSSKRDFKLTMGNYLNCAKIQSKLL